MGQGHSGVVGVPLVRVGLQGGCCMVVVAAGMRAGLSSVIAVRAATPRHWAVAATARAGAAGRGLVRAAGAVPSLMLGVWSP